MFNFNKKDNCKKQNLSLLQSILTFVIGSLSFVFCFLPMDEGLSTHHRERVVVRRMRKAIAG